MSKLKIGVLAVAAALGSMASVANANYLRYDMNATGGQLPEDPANYTASAPTVVNRNAAAGAGTLTESVSGGVYDVLRTIGGSGHLYFEANAPATGDWQIVWEGKVNASLGTTDRPNNNIYVWQIGTVAQSFVLQVVKENGADNTIVRYNGTSHTINDIDSHVIQFQNIGGVSRLLVDGVVSGGAAPQFLGFGAGGVGETDWGSFATFADWNATIDKVYFESGTDIQSYQQIIPEPASLGLMLAAGLSTLGRRRRA